MFLRRIETSRRFVQSALLVGILLIPFLVINGNPALRMDFGQRTLFLLGAALRIDQFYLVLLLVLVMVTGFLLLTVILGRVWCGWLCPQTVLNDLADLPLHFLQPLLPKRITNIVVHLFELFLALVFSINLLCWFMAPAEVFRTLVVFPLHSFVIFCFSSIFVVMYLNLVFIKREFCRSYCPYGRFQAALLDNGTLNLAFLEETRDRCIRCVACVRGCPMGIDIRQGGQVECINCGRCIDACRNVMERLDNNSGLIAYRFGQSIESSPRIGSKTIILTALLCILSATLAWSIYMRSDTAFSVQKIATVETRVLPDGSQVQAWKAIIGNRGKSPTIFALKISTLPGDKADLIGPVSEILISPNENRQISFFISFKDSALARKPFELMLLSKNIPVTTILVTP